METILVLTQSAANRAELRDRISRRLDDSYEELRVETWPSLAERILRDHALEAGVDPFFEPVGPADRLALMLDRLDELPLRRHEIRGNPAGLLARLLERIDALKAEGIGPAELRDRARAAERGAAERGEREIALREVEFSDLFDRHDAIMLAAGVLDENELVLELGRVLTRHPDLRSELGERFAWVMADELEDAGRPRVAVLPLLAPHRRSLATCDPAQGLKAHRAYGEAALVAFEREFPDADAYELAIERRVDARPDQGRGDRGGPGAGLLRAPAGARRRGRRGRGPALALLERAGAGAGRRARDRGPARVRAGGAGRDLRADRRRRAGEPARRRGARGALDPLPQRRLGRLLRPPGDPRRDRVASRDRRPGRLDGGRARADPSPRRAAVGRPGQLHEDRPPAQAGHDLGARGGAREPAALAALARSDQLLPEALPPRRAGDRRIARRRLRAPPDRADRLPPPRPVRGQPGDRGAAGQPLEAGRAGRELGAPPARGLDPRLRPLPGRGRRGRAAVQPARGAAGARLRLARRAGAGQGARVRARLRPRPGPGSAALGRRAGGVDPRRPGAARTAPRGRGRRRPAGPSRVRRLEPGDLGPGPLLRRAGPGSGGRALARLHRRSRGAGPRGVHPRGGALRPGRGPARDLPDDPRRGDGGLLARGGGAQRDAPRHGRRRQPLGRPVPRAAQARRADPAPRRGVRARGPRRAQRAARADRHARATGRAGALRARRLRPRRGAGRGAALRAAGKPRGAGPRAVHPAGAAAAWGSRHPTSTST